MSDHLDQDLVLAREAYEKAAAAKQRLDFIRSQIEELILRTEELAKIRAKEENDVSRLESGSLTVFFLSLFGKAEERLSREREEALQAAVLHDAACAQLDLLRQESVHLAKESRDLTAHRLRLETLLAEKKQRLSAVPHYADKLLALENALAEKKRYRREVSEAIRATTRALSTAEQAATELKEAEKLGNWDVFGGGLLVDMAKHSQVDAAQETINRLQGELRLMRSEINDVRIRADVQIKAEDFSRFTDMFWDNIFTDYGMLDRIHNAQTTMRGTCESLDAVLRRLNRLQTEAETACREAEDALHHYVEIMPL